MAIRVSVVLAGLLIAGCAKPAAQELPEVGDLAKLSEKAEKWQETAKRREAAQEELLNRLKADPQPLFDFALAKLKEVIPEHVGDGNAKSAEMTVDKGSLKTFGPKKWTVRGRLKVKDKDDRPRDTTWQVEIRADSGKLHAEHIRLDVKTK